jgi:hypothetical protein
MPHHTRASPDVSIIVPAFNQEGKLTACVRGIIAGVAKARNIVGTFEIIIAEDGSADGTHAEARALARADRRIRVLHSGRRLGKGGAICSAFGKARGKLFVFLDADGATNADHVGELVGAARKAGIAVGSRYLPQSRAQRSIQRRIFSSGYNFLVDLFFGSKISDHQCGFKAIRSDIAPGLCRQTWDRKWFWDTEMLILAQRQGIKVAEVPVEWREQNDTQFRLGRDIYYMAKSMARLWLRLNLGV